MEASRTGVKPASRTGVKPACPRTPIRQIYLCSTPVRRTRSARRSVQEKMGRNVETHDIVVAIRSERSEA